MKFRLSVAKQTNRFRKVSYIVAFEVAGILWFRLITALGSIDLKSNLVYQACKLLFSWTVDFSL